MIRLFDIVISFIALLVLSPVWLILAICIKLNSKGPVLYRQIRIGKRGKEFTLLKFRSMHINADKKGLLTVGGRDPRITSVGYFIRKYKLDELPQLWNVLIGQMSIVGPRPEVKKYVDLYSPAQRQILDLRPGITDMASISFRNENEILDKQPDPEKYYIDHIMPQKIQLNDVFIQHPTLANYLKIIFLTAAKIFKK
jgi:lipopolysaccharide/colanic/teichoic acid biosynthesis glycosyltransferase